jgi:hypothetical protein
MFDLEKDHIILKFGTFKGGLFRENPEAELLSDVLNNILSEREQKIITCQMIDKFNGPIFLWFDQRVCTREEAKEYVMGYDRPQF